MLGLQAYDIRSMFISAPGRSFIICDYSGIELVILAAMSGDAALKSQILGGDIHTYVANALYGEEIKAALGDYINEENKGDKKRPFKTIRDEFKRVSYGIIYGSTGWNLYRTCGNTFATYGMHITREECDRWVEAWAHELFPDTGKLLDRNAEQAITRRYTASVLGRRRQWPIDVRSSNRSMFAAMREGKNQPIQATSADITKLAMLRVQQHIDLGRARIVAYPRQGFNLLSKGKSRLNRMAPDP